MAAIAASEAGGIIIIPNLVRKWRKIFIAAGFQTPEDLLPLNDALETTAVVVHHGGMGICHAAVGKGIPQLIIHNDLDKYHTGKAIAKAGAGLELDRRYATKDTISQAIRELISNPSFTDRAMQLAKGNHPLLSTFSIAALADIIEGVLGKQ